MEDDDEGPPPPEEPTGRRCGRHPDQPITGVCSSCLVERLSSVRSPEIVEVPAAPSSSSTQAHAHEKPSVDQGKQLRKTLMLLFQMDDSGAAHAPDPEDPGPSQPDRPAADSNRGQAAAKWKGASWLRAILPTRRARRRRTKEEQEEPPRPSGAVDPHPSPPLAERRASFRRSCEWMVCRDPPGGGRGASSSSLDPPRHSWDGSMVGRAFACSFACLDDPPPHGVTVVRRSNAEESVGENRAAGVAVAESRNGGHSADVNAANGTTDAGPEVTAVSSGVRRRRSNRWSRVWDRSITSPLKEFVRKGEHALDRSVSESRKETRRCRNGDAAADIDGEIQPPRNGLVSGRPSQSASRSSQSAAAANGDAPNFRADWLKNKECRIGRSRSVHYTSPGNFDNGMLRFYLTPMRSNRPANRGRRRSSRLFARGLFGFV